MYFPKNYDRRNIPGNVLRKCSLSLQSAYNQTEDIPVKLTPPPGPSRDVTTEQMPEVQEGSYAIADITLININAHLSCATNTAYMSLNVATS